MGTAKTKKQLNKILKTVQDMKAEIETPKEDPNWSKTRHEHLCDILGKTKLYW